MEREFPLVKREALIGGYSVRKRSSRVERKPGGRAVFTRESHKRNTSQGEGEGRCLAAKRMYINSS